MQTIQFEVDEATAQVYREATAEQRAVHQARLTSDLRCSVGSRKAAVRELKALQTRVSNQAERYGLTESEVDAIGRDRS